MEDHMGNEITANDLKVKGITAIDELTSDGYEAVITVRGKQKYVVMTIEEYNKLREYELAGAIIEAKDDIKKGKFKKGSVEDHIKRIEHV
jgi:PHD/YefM family antitoxin component YafN of YafNO toxin-antitoxin module